MARCRASLRAACSSWTAAGARRTPTPTSPASAAPSASSSSTPLLARLAAGEVEAVLAHELGHFKLRHIRKRMLAMAAITPRLLRAARLALDAGLVLQRPRRRAQPDALPNDALALLLLLPGLVGVRRVRVAAASPAGRAATSSRPTPSLRRTPTAATWRSALLKLHEDNASTLTPDPLYARFYYSHPPAVERLAALVRPRHRSRSHHDQIFLHQKCQARASADERRQRSATTSPR